MIDEARNGGALAAVKWNGNNPDEIDEFCSDDHKFWMAGMNFLALMLVTREGNVVVEIGDWIMKNAGGGFSHVQNSQVS